ncbi:ABC transporter transmembrane domain-containing protein [Paeniglutamicibacter sp.]|uniref:ABC transporter transmembrane domain-containing protein n=1 Tax=Paeniglutamicibacter sp. TaxID=1934391 RepID=UPI0039892344
MSGLDALMEGQRAPATQALDIVPAATDRAPVPRLPKLVTGRRRGLFAALLALATACGALGVGVALLVGALVSGGAVLPMSVGIGALILVLGYGRYLERVLAEKLGQHYVAQLRLSLISHSLLAAKVPSVGITVARASNDLSSVRNWVAQGIAPLLAGVPLVLISMAGLWMIHPALALGLGAPVLVLAVALLLLAAPAYERARILRRHRGNLAARIADTVAASSAVVASGGVARELSRVAASGNKVVDAAVSRARLAGVLRACSLGMPLLATAVVVLVSRNAALGAGHIATALTLLGLCAAPVGEWGRIVEYRQNYRAASRIIAPLLEEESALSAGPALRHKAPRAAAQIQASRIEGVWLHGLEIDGKPVPELRAEPGERIRMVGADAQLRGELFTVLATARTHKGPILGDLGHDAANREQGYVVACVIPGSVGEKKRRRLIGAAFASMVPERGTLLRALRYRRPDADPAKALALAGSLGLDTASLEHGEDTQLRRGGMPLDAAQRAGLMVARAMLGSPSLLLLNEIDGHLDAAARGQLEKMLETYRGVVIVCSESEWCAGYREWNLDAPEAGSKNVPGLSAAVR